MKTKNRTFTPVDIFVQTYIMDHPKDIEYHPGDHVSFKAPMLLADEIEELIKAVDDLGLEVHFEGSLVVWETQDEAEEPLEEEPEAEAPVVAEVHDMTPEELRAEADRIEEKMRELGPVVEEPLEEHSRTYAEVEADEEAVEIEVESEEPVEEDLIPEVIRNLPQDREEEATEI